MPSPRKGNERGRKALDFDFLVRSLRDFTGVLIRKLGLGVKKAALDQHGEIGMPLRVVVNPSERLLYGERMDTPLHEGDTLHWMTMG